MHYSDLIVVEGRLAKTQAELSNETRRRIGLERRIDELIPELTRLRAENARLQNILAFSRWSHDTHRPSYALNCLYEGEITIAKFCEWMKAYVAGVDEPLPDVPYRSCGSEHTPKELEAEVARLRAALEPFARWATQMDSPPNWVPDGCPIIVSPGDISDFCVGMLRRAKAALAGKEQENASSQT